MADERTPEQRAADDALDAAVKAAAVAYGGEAATHLLTSWMVIGTAIPADPDTDDDDRTFVFLPDGGKNTHRSAILGMLWSGQLAVLEGDDLT